MTSRYDSLTTFLLSQSADVVDIPMSRLDAIVGGLPASARKHAAWWANGPKSHAHAAAWGRAGRDASPNFNGGFVRFTRVDFASEIVPPTGPGPLTSPGGDAVVEGAQLLVATPSTKQFDGRSRRIGLVGCVKTKAPSSAPAQDLYLSPLFRGRREYVEHSCDEWWVLSALHGLVSPTTVIDPYDVTLKGASTAEHRRWSNSVLASIIEIIKPVPGDTFEFHAGADYRNFGLAQGLEDLGCTVTNPTEGMAQGKQVSFYQNVRWT